MGELVGLQLIINMNVSHVTCKSIFIRHTTFFNLKILVILFWKKYVNVFITFVSVVIHVMLNRYHQYPVTLIFAHLRPELKPLEKEIAVTLKFPEVEKLNSPILQLDEVSFYYTKGKTIFSGVDLSAAMDSRICIVSPLISYQKCYVHLIQFSVQWTSCGNNGISYLEVDLDVISIVVHSTV